MPAKILTTGPDLADPQVDAALLVLPPFDDNALTVFRHLQDQITALTARVESLEAP